MRRLRLVMLAVALLGCGSDGPTGPQETVDGNWAGLTNGYQMSFTMTQTGTDVTGTALVAGALGAAIFTVSGTFVKPSLVLTLSAPNFESARFEGTLSATDPTIAGKLNGSGFTDFAISLKKK